MERQVLYTSRSHHDAFEENMRLDKLFLNTFRRSSKSELFFFSEGSTRETERYGVTLYHLPEHKNELDFFVKNVKASAP